MRNLPVIALLSVVASHAALAQPTNGSDPGRALVAACKQEYRTHCTGDNPSAPIAAACLSQYYMNLSRSCQAALDAYTHPGQGTDDD